MVNIMLKASDNDSRSKIFEILALKKLDDSSENETHSTVTEPSATQSSDNKTSQIALYVAIAFGILSALLFISLVLLQIRRRKQRTILNTELEQMCYATRNERLKYKMLRSISEKLMKNVSEAKLMIKNCVGSEIEDRQLEKNRETIKIMSCRYPKLQCTIKSQVHVSSAPKYILHMNKFYDFDNVPLYLSTAPLPEELPLFMQAVVDEEISLIVWIGVLFETHEKFEPYLPINRAKNVRCGTYVLHNIRSNYSKSKGFDDFEIGISKVKASHQTEDRKLLILHLDFWPDSEFEGELAKLSKFVKHLFHIFEQQKKVSRLNGVLFHGFDGVHQSAAFCTIFLGYQLWLKRKEVNLLAIMRYIRKHRHCAFTFDENKSYILIPVIFGTMEVLASFGHKM